MTSAIFKISTFVSYPKFESTGVFILLWTMPLKLSWATEMFLSHIRCKGFFVSHLSLSPTQWTLWIVSVLFSMEAHTCSHVKHWKVMRRCFSLHELSGVAHTCMCSLTLLLLYTHTTVLSVFCCIVSFGQNSVGGRFCPQPAIQVIKLATVTSDIVCISPPENLWQDVCVWFLCRKVQMQYFCK